MFAARSYEAIRPPPSPAIAAESAKATMRVRVRLMPIDEAATSLPRTASRYRPVVPLRTQMTMTLDDDQDDERQDEERPIVVRRAEVERPDRAAGAPRPARSRRRPTRGAGSRCRRSTRTRASRATRRRRRAATREPRPSRRRSRRSARRGASRGSPRCRRAVASCAVAHAPMAPKVARHNEICPPSPVITVIDKKMIAQDRGL